MSRVDLPEEVKEGGEGERGGGGDGGGERGGGRGGERGVKLKEEGWRDSCIS